MNINKRFTEGRIFLKLRAAQCLAVESLLLIEQAAKRLKADIHAYAESAGNFPESVCLPDAVIDILKSRKAGLFSAALQRNLILRLLSLFSERLDLGSNLRIQETLSVCVTRILICELLLEATP